MLGRSSIIPILFLLLTSWRAQNHSFPLILLTLILKYTKSLNQLHSVNFFTSALLLCVKSRHSDEKILTSSKQIWLQLCQSLPSGDVYLTSLTPWTKYFSSYMFTFLTHSRILELLSIKDSIFHFLGHVCLFFTLVCFIFAVNEWQTSRCTLILFLNY